MHDPRELVKSYLEAIGARDFELARTFLADKGFSYKSPIGVADDADHFIASISAVGPILEKLNIRHLFVEQSEVIAIVDILVTLHGYVTRTIALLFHLENGRIRSIEAIFDATEYHRMFEA